MESLPPAKLESTLARSVRDGCFHAVMLGSGEAYLAAFAVFLGAGSVTIGLLASLPLLVGSLAQLGAVHLLDRIPRRKPLLIIPAFVQGLSWIPILLAPHLFPSKGPLLLVAASLVYFSAGSFIVPAWNSLMGDLVPPASRGDYFGRRDRLRTMWQFAAVLAAGGILSVSKTAGVEYWGFASVFIGALAARLSSTYEQVRMEEPTYERPLREQTFTLLQFLGRVPKSNFGRFTVYIAAVQTGTQIAAPFFTLYMLRDLRFSYLQFTAASTVTILAQAITFHNWGKLADRLGNVIILRWTGLAVAFIPLMWLLSPRFELVLVYQIIAGFVWAGFLLSSANFLFDAVSPPKRPRCVAYYSLLANSGMFLGASVGGWLAPILPDKISILGVSLPLVSNLQVLFLISALARLGVSLLFLPLIKEVRQVEKRAVWHVLFQIVGLSAIRGFRFSVFNGGGPGRSAEGSESLHSERDLTGVDPEVPRRQWDRPPS